jgi:gamma-glutamylcyclotransferase (GGCT)/AIG2-like uncharacterized protein YtfP
MYGEAADYLYFMCRPDGLEVKEKAEDMEEKPADTLDYVFVYGTLLQGQGNHKAFLGSSYFLGSATTKDMFAVFGSNFPLARKPIEADNSFFTGQISGEVYGVTKDILRKLDRLEGHPNFYERRIILTEEYPRKMIWMYQWANETGAIVGENVTPDPTTRIISWRRHVARTE